MREIPSSKLSVTVPILVVGLFDIDESGQKIESWNVAEITDDMDIVKDTSKKNSMKYLKLIEYYLNI